MNLNLTFSLPAEERKTTLLSAFLLFAITAAFIVLKSARDALFLSNYPAGLLPYFMALSTLTTALVAAAYLHIYKVLSLSQAVDLCLKAFAVGTLILWAGIKSNWHLATPILYVWASIFGSLAPVQAWTVISQQFLTRQAKRSVGLIGAGGIAGASAGGFFARWVTEGSSVSALLPTATILILLSLFASQALAVLKWTPPSSERKSQPPMIHKKFVALVLIVVGTGTAVTTFADFQFKVVAQRELATAEALATFFGSFYAFTGIATLFFQILVTPFLISRMGVSSALSFLPLGLVAGNGMLLATGSLAAAVVLKGSEQLFQFSIYRSSLEVLYMAIPERAKVRLKSLIDTVGEKMSDGTAAILLILLFSVGNLPIEVLTIFALALCAACILCTILLSREYPKVLKGAIKQDDMSLTMVKAEFFTTDFYNLLPELLQKSNRETVLDLLQMLGSGGGRKLKNYLVPLLKYPDAEIRLKALQLLFTQEEDFSPQVEQLINDPDRRIRVEAIHYLCFRASIDPLEKLAHLLSDPEPMIQAAACACSLNQEMEQAQKMAYERLEQLLASSASQTEVRLEVAHILEYVKSTSSSAKLAERLLSDPSLSVRKAMLRSIAKTRPPGIEPTLIGILADPAVRTELRSALSAYGEAVLPELQKALRLDSQSVETKKMILRVAAEIGTPKTIDLLFEIAQGANLVLRFIAIKALNRMKKRGAIEFPRNQALSLLEQELRALEVELERAEFISPQPGRLMDAVLSQRQFWALERIFRVLGLLYDSKAIYNAYLAVTGKDRRRADSALEFLDAILSPEHRYRLLELLESQRQRKRKYDRSTRKNMLFGYLGARDQLPAAAMVADLTAEEFGLWRSEIDQAFKTFGNLPLVEETFNRRYSDLDGTDNLKHKLTTIQKLENLNKIDIFSQLGPQELLLLANHCNETEFDAGKIIFKEGETGNDIFALVRGSVELRRSSGHLARVRPGQSFGTLSVLSDQPRIVTATALEHSLCLKIDGQSFWEILEDYPSLSQSIFKLLAQRIRILIDQPEMAREK